MKQCCTYIKHGGKPSSCIQHQQQRRKRQTVTRKNEINVIWLKIITKSRKKKKFSLAYVWWVDACKVFSAHETKDSKTCMSKREKRRSNKPIAMVLIHTAQLLCPNTAAHTWNPCSFLIIEITRKNLQLFLPFSLHLFLLNHFAVIVVCPALILVAISIYTQRVRFSLLCCCSFFSRLLCVWLGLYGNGNLLAYRASTKIMIRHTKRHGDGGA